MSSSAIYIFAMPLPETLLTATWNDLDMQVVSRPRPAVAVVAGQVAALPDEFRNTVLAVAVDLA